MIQLETGFIKPSSIRDWMRSKETTEFLVRLAPEAIEALNYLEVTLGITKNDIINLAILSYAAEFESSEFKRQSWKLSLHVNMRRARTK